MSAKTVETILSRANSDAAFAESLFADAEVALKGYDLTAEEAANLKGLARADFDAAAAGSPEQRQSFFIYANHNQSALKI